MVPVILESPLAAPTPEGVAANVAYARRCVRDCLERGESPYASHLLLAQEGILDDRVPAERELGIEAGLAWQAGAVRSVVYLDRGISSGVWRGVQRAVSTKYLPDVQLRWLDGPPLVHALKTLPEFFGDVLGQRKPFELRRDDRGFEAGHVLRLREWDGERFTGRHVFRLVTYVLRDALLPKGMGLDADCCILGILPIEPSPLRHGREGDLSFALAHHVEPAKVEPLASERRP